MAARKKNNPAKLARYKIQPAITQRNKQRNVAKQARTDARNATKTRSFLRSDIRAMNKVNGLSGFKAEPKFTVTVVRNEKTAYAYSGTFENKPRVIYA